MFEQPKPSTWSRATVDSRNAYTSLKEHFLKYIDHPSKIDFVIDPLDDNQTVSLSLASLLVSSLSLS